MSRSAVSSTTQILIRTSHFAREGRRRRTTHGGPRQAMSRVHSRSPRVLRVPIHVAAKGEAQRTRHRRAQRRRRGASPECSVSAGLHPSPGTVHPRRHQHGGGDGENIGTAGTPAQMKIAPPHNPEFIFPAQSTTLVGDSDESPGHALLRRVSALNPQFRGFSRARRLLLFTPEVRRP